MSNQHQDLGNFWDEIYNAVGHTGYVDPLLIHYDQPIRLKTVDRILTGLFSQNDSAPLQALDIGCGTGDFIALLRNRNMVVNGIDISPQVIRATQRRFETDKNVTFVCGSVADVSLPETTYDVITSVTVLQHVLNDRDLIAALERLRDAMKTDGRMIVLELAPLHHSSLAHYSQGIHYLLERPPHIWHEIFAKAGLTVVSEPIMPQLGITLLRGFGFTINKIREFFSSSRGVEQIEQTDSVISSNDSDQSILSLRKIKRKVFHYLRKILLAIAWPFDHLMQLPLPFKRWRHYRLFVLKKNEGKI